MHIEIQAIGTVHTAATDDVNTRWREMVSTIHIDESFISGLHGLDDWSHIVVIFSMHETTFDPEKHLLHRPNDRADLPEKGVFAQRSTLTPNKIGMTTVKLMGIEGNVLTVKGLDAIDGTPVLDIKPFAPVYDGAIDPGVPVWFLRLMQGE
ncbi:MAG: tRNA (N6-threonylcarbamoyladenosine(37)-N6)-methyltransferase TrmO [Chloroflexota bacterium]